MALSNILEEMNAYVATVDDATFKKSVNGKWSIAQNIDHLTISNTVTTAALGMPRIVLKQLFKTNQRPLWNYDEVVWRYQRSLGNGAKASLPYQPKISLMPVRALVMRFWKGSSKSLLKALDACSETDLDTYLIPHPIIGKMTLRELLFFTIYHIGHHLNTVKNIR